MHDGALRFLPIAPCATHASPSFAFALACCVVACGGGASGLTAPPAAPPVLTSVKMTLVDTMLVGASATASAVGLDQYSVPIGFAPPAWSSTEPSIATVSANGVVSALAAGVVSVVASVNDKQGLRLVTVVQAPVARLVLTPDAPRLSRGRTLQLNAGAANGGVLTGRTATWSVSGTSGGTAVSVSSSGQVVALAPDSVIVEAFSEGKYAAVTLVALDNFDDAIVVSFASPAATDVVGDTLRVLAGVKSARPLVSVVATVGPFQKTVPMKLTPVGAMGYTMLWLAVVDVTDLATGPYKVLVTATDDRGRRGAGTISFMRDTRAGKGGSSDTPKMK